MAESINLDPWINAWMWVVQNLVIFQVSFCYQEMILCACTHVDVKALKFSDYTNSACISQASIKQYLLLLINWAKDLSIMSTSDGVRVCVCGCVYVCMCMHVHMGTWNGK